MEGGEDRHTASQVLVTDGMRETEVGNGGDGFQRCLDASKHK